MNKKEADKLFNDLAKQLYSNSSNKINNDLLLQTAQLLSKGVLSGYNSKDMNSIDAAMIASLQQNVFVFSSAKTYTQMQHMKSLLLDDTGQLKTFSQYKNDILSVFEKYNVNYLQAEYNYAVSSSQMASKWMSFKKQGNPILRYDTVGDDRVRREHELLDGVKKALKDPWWDTHYPPLGWRCRCDVTITEGKVTDDDKTPLLPVQALFKNNTGKTKRIYDAKHPYFKHLEKDKDKIKLSNYIANLYRIHSDEYNPVAKHIQVHTLAKQATDYLENLALAKILADKNNTIKLPPYINLQNIHNPDLLVNDIVAEAKSINIATANNIKRLIQYCINQGAKIAILNIKTKTEASDLYRAIRGKIIQKKSLQSVILIKGDIKLEIDRRNNDVSMFNKITNFLKE